jgi:hypothetical protein
MTAQHDRLAGITAGARFDRSVREAVPMPIYVPDEVTDAVPRLGPESLIWKFYGDHRTQFFGFQRTAGVENCIEQLAQGVLDHSVIFSDTLGRAKRTAPPLMKPSTPTTRTGGAARCATSTSPSKAPSATARGITRSIRSCSIGRTPPSSTRSSTRPTRSSAGCPARKRSRSSTRGRSGTASTGSATAGSRRPMTSSSPTGTRCSTGSSRTKPSCTAPATSGGEYRARAGFPIPGPRWIPKPVWKALSAPLNAYTRLVLVGTLPPQMREVCRLEWDAKKERRFQRFAAVSVESPRQPAAPRARLPAMGCQGVVPRGRRPAQAPQFRVRRPA